MSDDALLHAVLRAGIDARDLSSLREAMLDALLRAVPADIAVLHALSPRVPLETAALRGITREALAATLPGWDAAAVALAPLRERATALGGVARDTDAFPRRGPARSRYDQALRGVVGAGHTLVAHLAVRERIVAAAVLFRTPRRGPFTDAEAAAVRAAVPAMSLADALHQCLDATPQRPVATRLRCEDQRLTARQREVVELVAHGHTNDAIAAALALSPNTLRNHLAEVFRRLGASNRADVVRLAVLR